MFSQGGSSETDKISSLIHDGGDLFSMLLPSLSSFESKGGIPVRNTNANA